MPSLFWAMMGIWLGSAIFGHFFGINTPTTWAIGPTLVVGWLVWHYVQKARDAKRKS